MNQNITNKLLGLIALIVLPFTLFGQGVTTSSMNGRITGTDGEPLIGATVTAVHTPSGSTYGNITNNEGIYRIPNMRVGGPYIVKISYVGYGTKTQEGVYLTLGQAFKFSTPLSETGVTIEGVEITSSRTDVFDGNRTGQQTVIDEATINNSPTVTRSIADFARINPMARIGEGGDGFSISINGQNNRFNTIYIDGAVNNDVFGLAGSGTNGGQTGVQPVSIDAIEQFQVSVAPFDVRQSGFAGGAINAVTRSGTNDIEASVYGFYRNQGLTGLDPLRDSYEDERTAQGDTLSRAAYRDQNRVADFTALTTGLRIGGPIVKDKVFFFINAELQRDNIPQPFNIDTYDGNITDAQLQELSDFVQNTYGYNMGVYDENTAFLNSEKFLAKVDFNLDNNNKLSVRHSYVQARNLEARNSSPGSINFVNGSEFFLSTTNSTAVELSSLFGNNMSNDLKIGLTIVRDDRDPYQQFDGAPFPTVELSDGDNGTINFGSERFSTANLLNQDVLTINDNFQLFKGRHTALFGLNFEYFNAGNLFIRNNYGRYRYFDTEDTTGMITSFGWQDFINGNPATQFERSFSQVDDVSGDESQAIAAFQQILVGAYIQDEFQASDDLKLTLGLRLDVPLWLTDVPLNEGFNNTTIPAIQDAYNDPEIMEGAQTGQFISPQLLWAPRFGFNYDVTGENKTQLRGGIGIFTSRIPLVWPGGAYNNYGLNIGETGASNVAFNPDVQDQLPDNVDFENPTPSGQVDLFADNFKLPQLLKVNLGFDQRFGDGYILTLEGIYTKNINYLTYKNLNLKPSTESLSGPDDRPLYAGLNPGFGGDPVDPTYTNIILASNTNRGYGYNLAATLTTPVISGFTGQVSYSYGDAFNVFDGTSSQNNSQWRGYFGSNGRNNFAMDDIQRSTFAAGHRIFAQLAYAVDYANFAKTTISVAYTGRSGNPFTYVVGAQNFQWVDDGGFGFNEPIYVPAAQNEIILEETTVDGTTYSAADQWAILNDYIENDPHLSGQRGEYAGRNGRFLPFESFLDLRILQDFYIEQSNGDRHTLQLSLDIFNFTNLINPNWGRSRGFSFGTYSLLNLEDFDSQEGTVSYSLNPEVISGENPWDDDVDVTGFRSSRWSAQVGVRYLFE